jgi:hypothetical protein
MAKPVLERFFQLIDYGAFDVRQRAEQVGLGHK